MLASNKPQMGGTSPALSLGLHTLEIASISKMKTSSNLTSKRRPFVGHGANLSLLFATISASFFAAPPSLAIESCNPLQVAPYPSSCQVVINSKRWEISTVSDSFDMGTDVAGFDLTDSENAPWWGSVNTAINFASAVGWGLGFPNNSGFTGPTFAYNFPDGFEVGTVIGRVAASSQNSNIYVDGGGTGVVTNFAYARAVDVPGPLPFLGIAVALGISRRLRKRVARNTGSSLQNP